MTRIKKKLIYIVLDGAADGLRENSSLSLASTPNMDEVAQESIGGLHYPVRKGVAPESDSAVFSLLGYDPERFYVGRGPVDALGVGLNMKDDYEVALRGNLASADFARGIIIDRRVGRDITTEEAMALLRGCKHLELGIYEGYARLKVGLKYRFAVVIGSRKYKLSDMISNTDPAYSKRGSISIALPDYSNNIVECTPINSDNRAVITAKLVNKFIDTLNLKLVDHPVNRRRIRMGKLPANTVILRDAGMKPKGIPKMKRYYRLSFIAIADMPTEIGIAKLLGMKVYKSPPMTGDFRRDCLSRVEYVLDASPHADAVYIHIKGPDIYGHDGDMEGKIKSLEEIDSYFIGPLLNRIDLDQYAILITMDHSTPPQERRHTDDPVPYILRLDNKYRDKFQVFSEYEVYKKGSLGILGSAWMMMPIIIKLLSAL
jgi:2,3-bisphosphoglycerate-independent phosphoglycerate mutase